MRIRHRVPTLFTLSMLDVFCCALGCVIFLWLWNEHLAKQKSIKAGQTQQELEKVEQQLVDARYLIDSLKTDLTSARQLIAARTADLDQRGKELALVQSQADALKKDLTDAKQLVVVRTSDLDKTRAELTEAQKSIIALNKDLTASRQTLTILTAERDQVRKDLSATQEQLTRATESMRDLQTKANNTADLLAKSAKEREKLAADMAGLTEEQKKEREKLADQLATMKKAEDKLAADLADLRDRKAKIDSRATDLADLLVKKTKDQEKLAVEFGELQALKKKSDEALTAAKKREAELETLVRQKDELLVTSKAKSKEMEDRLHDADALVKQMRDSLPGMKADLDQQNKKLVAAETRVTELEKDLLNRKQIMMDVQGQMSALQGEKKSLNDQIGRLRLAADNRFAGIQLTGRRIVLLIDMSGSMVWVDEKTEAPQKWDGVVETAVKILKSLPDLEKFQVVLFNETSRYLYGNSTAEWIDIDPKNSNAVIEKVRQALKAVEVKGNTNMYTGFEKAFAFRANEMGLDTIYLLSDGLPNVGPGLSAADQARKLPEIEQAEKLSKYIRAMLKQYWNREPKVRINCVGFFYESPDVGAFLWALARENDGSFVGMSKP
jgi:hypothetical protein